MGTCAPRSAEVELDGRKPSADLRCLRHRAVTHRHGQAGGTCAGRWPFPTGGTRLAGGDPLMDTPPSSAAAVGEREGHGPLLCVRVPKVLHGRGWREHVLYLRAATLASLSPTYLRSLIGTTEDIRRNWQLALVLPTQPTPSMCFLLQRRECFPVQTPCQGRTHQPEVRTPALQGLFFWQVFYLQGWSPRFDNSPQGRSIHQVPLPCALI